MKTLITMILLFLLAACAPTDTGSTTSPTNNDSGDPIPTREGAADPIPTREGAADPDAGSGFGFDTAIDPNAGFGAELSGAENGVINGDGTINCENNVYVIRPSLENFPQISLILPEGASSGTFTLVNNPGDGSAPSASVFFADGRVFAAAVDGILIVNDLATQAGQSVTGSFDFSASSGSQVITAIGEFNFVSDADDTYC